MKRVSGIILLALLSLLGQAALGKSKPNLLIVVADDLGWADVGYHGSQIPTPYLDKLCRNGVELDAHYVAPMCTPTRTALLTGRYWSRFGNTTAQNEQVLPFGTVTIASAFRDSGYATFISGKWHLGSLKKWGPLQFGFQNSHGSLAGGVNPWNHLYKPGPYSVTWHRNDELIKQEGHVTDLITEETVRFIEKKREEPFFIYVPFTAPHIPIDEPQKWLNRCKHIPEERRQYAACVTHLDHSVGRFIETIDRIDQREQTIFLFFSDNGGHLNANPKSLYPKTVEKARKVGLNTPLRGQKGQVYEGGIRTPAFINWPGKLKPNKITSPLHVSDWMPTLCKVIGYKPEQELNWDGQDIWPILSGNSKTPQSRVLYTKGPGGKSTALREGEWKLIRHGSGEKGKFELFNIIKDPNEKKDLARAKPKIVDRLHEMMLQESMLDNDSIPSP